MRLRDQTIVIVDVDTGEGKLDLIAAALMKHVHEHLVDSWPEGLSIDRIRAASTAEPPLPDEVRAELRSAPGDPGALAEHIRQADGRPLLLCFAQLCERDGVPFSAALCHEVDEFAVDPFLRRGVQDLNGIWTALEIDDAVEGYTYDIDGITMSNFCLPAWFEPAVDGDGRVITEPWDYLGKCSGPFNVRTENGGYKQTWSPDAGWAVGGAMRPGRKIIHELGFSRGARRAA